jgi:uncharacterized protein YecE (DUF72 family)
MLASATADIHDACLPIESGPSFAQSGASRGVEGGIGVKVRETGLEVRPAVARLHVGCAGWSIPGDQAAAFPVAGSHLQRYAGRLAAVEINSSFYRPHRISTYARWARAVPAPFRFAVKLPRTITHEQRLVDCGALLGGFLSEVGVLGDRLGCLLVQLPPSLAWRNGEVERFLRLLRSVHSGPVALEPRHASWFVGAASVQLALHRVARVGADPSPGHAGDRAAGDRGMTYFRLHGSPRTYYSAYGEADLDEVAARVVAATEVSTDVWCIFDNTALGAATRNALGLLDRLASRELPGGRHAASRPNSPAETRATLSPASSGARAAHR